MGLSFSGLSLVTATGAELGINAEVREGVGGELQHRTAALTVNGPATQPKGGLSDIESDQEAVLYTGVDGQQPIPRDLPPQASPFSAVWASAVGWTDPEVSLPVLEAPSILASEDSPVGRGASQERLADLLASSRGAFEATQVTKLLHGAQWITAGPGSGQDTAVDFNVTSIKQAAHPEALAKSPAALLQEALRSDHQPNGDIALADDNLSTNVERTVSFEEKTTQIPTTETRREFKQFAKEQNGPATAALTEQIAQGLANQKRELIVDRTAFRDLRENVAKEKSGGGSNRPALNEYQFSESTANIYAPPTTTTNTAPEAPRSSSVARGSEPGANHPAVLPQPTGGVEVSAAVAAESRALHGSEVAFQAELRLRNQAQSSDTAPVNDRAANEPRLTPTVLEANHAKPEIAPQQPPEAEASLEELESAQREAFRRIADTGRPESPVGQDHAGAGLDRGIRQAPIAPSTTASQPVTSTAASPKQPAMPAAAQLDAFTLDAPAEVSSPARSVAFKVHNGDNGAANVILTDRGGQVHVTVRSSDPTLTQSLRSDLGSLSGSFQQHGFDVKVWNPSSGSSAGDHSRSHSFEFGQDDLRGDGRQRHFFDDTRQQRQRAEWPEEID